MAIFININIYFLHFLLFLLILFSRRERIFFHSSFEELIKQNNQNNYILRIPYFMNEPSFSK